MSKRQTKFTCECGVENLLIYKKPDHFTPTVSTFNCVGCDTRFQYQINKHKADPSKIELHTKILKLSDTLRLLRMENDSGNSNFPESP